MSRLPVIVGMGGINSAGRTSLHHGYKRLVIDQLAHADADSTWQSLAQLMGIHYQADQQDYIKQHTLIRRIESSYFDTEQLSYHQAEHFQAGNSVVLAKRKLPVDIPAHWQVEAVDERHVKVTFTDNQAWLLPATRQATVRAAGQLPSGFRPDQLYPSRNHPRGLQLTVYGASDALGSLGIDWQQVMQLVKPDQVAVYAGSGMSQLDYNGNGGMLKAQLLGKRVTSKQCPLGMAEMPADFINAYLLGSVGNTGTSMGACATFLYNLKNGIDDIRSGRCRVAVVGNAEAPLLPEVFDGYGTMGALATDNELRALDKLAADHPLNYQRACRPFGENCGFTLAESAQFVVLFDDELALELGANVLGAVGDVFVNADGFKKSISSPGVGNYLTVAKAMASARAILGEEALRLRSFVQAHGTGTPQNRVTESHILDKAAEVFGITDWPITAVKAFVGHSIAAAAGDQLASTLGVWQYGVLPGITTIDKPAADVYQKHLKLNTQHQTLDKTALDIALLNSKGFGGNNATAFILAPHITQQMLQKKHGKAAYQHYLKANEQVQANVEAYDQRCITNQQQPVYQFGEGVIDGEAIQFDSQTIRLPGFEHEVSLDLENPYPDMV
ncbi:beta-ketoacyl synthase [Spartinivicinus ruber]|uniref:beta-ketoacyl synthase n=1 Tax=Spartinivicinus ruber TaxID=2683272 RepID=UPI0013D6AABD|nr:beta-ketoacyl synthase [Spartinivicinus ruber]